MDTALKALGQTSFEHPGDLFDGLLDDDDFLPFNLDGDLFSNGTISSMDHMHSPSSTVSSPEKLVDHDSDDLSQMDLMQLDVIQNQEVVSDGVVHFDDHGRSVLDWVAESSAEANSDSSLSLSPPPPSSRTITKKGRGRKCKQEPSPQPSEPQDLDDDDLDFDDSVVEHKLTVHADAMFELHNYSTAHLGPTNGSVKFTGGNIKNYSTSRGGTSTNVSPSSSTNSSPNARGKGRGARGKPITELALTEEEKRLLCKEGYSDFPMTGALPLTKQEEKILRKVRRKIRNKRSAQCSRQRKKEYVEELEKKYEKCNNENDVLRREVLKLKKENSNLMVKMRSLLAGSSQASLKTSFFVIILSFLLVLVPYLRPDSMLTDDSSMMSVVGSGETFTTGRHLLMVGNGSGQEHYVDALYEDASDLILSSMSSVLGFSE